VTKKELSQVYWLKKEIEMQTKQLEEFENLATSCSRFITGMPRIPGFRDKISEYAAEIADLKSLIDLNIKKCFFEFNRINRYINSVDDSLVRQILSLRYIGGMSWRKVAFSVGGRNTEDTVRMIHNRFLSRN
jgi:hypothetical protein